MNHNQIKINYEVSHQMNQNQNQSNQNEIKEKNKENKEISNFHPNDTTSS